MIIALLCFPAGVSICRRLPRLWWRAGSLRLQRASWKSCVWGPMQNKAGYWAEAPVSVGWRNGASVELWQSGEQKADFREQKQDIPKESLLSGIVKPAVYKKCSPSLWYLYPYTQYFHCNCLRANIMHSLRQTMPTKPLHSVVFSAPAVESPWQTSLVLQWPIKGKTLSLCVCVHCVGVWHLRQHAGDGVHTVGLPGDSSVRQPPRLLTSCLHCSDNRWRQNPLSDFLCVSPPFLSLTSSSLLSWSQRQASSASSADSQRSSGDCSLSPHRAQLVWHNKTMFLDFH